VDTLNSTLGDIEQSRRALSKFFQQENDSQAQYVLMNLGRQINVIQDSTRNPSSTLSELASKQFQSSILNSEASSIALASEQLRRMLQTFPPQACSGPAVRMHGTIPDNCSAMKQRVKIFITTSAERTALLTRAFLQELKAIINAMADTPTERTLILISDGLNLVPGREPFGIASYFPDEPEWRSNERDTQPELDELLRLAQKQNVIVYALDSRGLYSPASQGGNYDAASSAQGSWQAGQALNEMDRQANTIAWEQGSAMAQLAAVTGGL
jgi:VWFA-related protein